MKFIYAFLRCQLQVYHWQNKKKQKTLFFLKSNFAYFFLQFTHSHIRQVFFFPDYNTWRRRVGNDEPDGLSAIHHTLPLIQKASQPIWVPRRKGAFAWIAPHKFIAEIHSIRVGKNVWLVVFMEYDPKKAESQNWGFLRRKKRRLSASKAQNDEIA